MDLNQPLILDVVFVNVQGLTNENVRQLSQLQRQLEFKVLALTETWHSPWPEDGEEGGVQHENLQKLVRALGPGWTLFDTPCLCCPKIFGLGSHGLAILIHPDLHGSPNNLVQIPTREQTDHRQLAVVIKAKNPVGGPDVTCNMVLVHYRSGVNPGKRAMAEKRLQLRATVNHLEGHNDQTSILIAGGDMNSHPEFNFFGEVMFQFRRIGMIVESTRQLWDPNNPPWTHHNPNDPTIAQNMLDQVAVRTPKNITCTIDLLGPPVHNITTDHPRFLHVKYFLDPSGTLGRPTILNPVHLFKADCYTCGRGCSSDGRMHGGKICPCVTEADILRSYEEALAGRTKAEKKEEDENDEKVQQRRRAYDYHNKYRRGEETTQEERDAYNQFNKEYLRIRRKVRYEAETPQQTEARKKKQRDGVKRNLEKREAENPELREKRMENDRKRKEGVGTKPGHDRINYLLGPRKSSLTAAEIEEVHRLIKETGYKLVNREMPQLKDAVVRKEEKPISSLTPTQKMTLARYLFKKAKTAQLTEEEVVRFLTVYRQISYSPRPPIPPQIAAALQLPAETEEEEPPEEADEEDPPVPEPSSSRSSNLGLNPGPTIYSESDSE